MFQSDSLKVHVQPFLVVFFLPSNTCHFMNTFYHPALPAYWNYCTCHPCIHQAIPHILRTRRNISAPFLNPSGHGVFTKTFRPQLLKYQNSLQKHVDSVTSIWGSIDNFSFTLQSHPSNTMYDYTQSLLHGLQPTDWIFISTLPYSSMESLRFYD